MADHKNAKRRALPMPPATVATIYALMDPRNDAIRYVGRTTQGLRARLSGHLSGGPFNGRARFDWIRGLAALGLCPKIVPLDVIAGSESDWVEAEKRWISKLRAEGVDLLNVETPSSSAQARILAARIPGGVTS